MNILFLTIGRFESIEQHSIYPDLLREFRDHGHTVYAISSYEKRTGKQTELIEENGAYSLHVRIGNITKCGMIEKGISTVMIESQYLNAIKKHLRGVRFDLVIYSTPPITLVNVVKFIKKRDGAKSYLLLKDIFPQNAVDIGIMKKSGLKGLLYRYFRAKEKKLYAISDYIGCMSPANVSYVLEHNPEIDAERVEVCPNAVEVFDTSVDERTRDEIRDKYGIPKDKKVFVYGGNLGRPQGIPYLIECLKTQLNSKDLFFLIVGDGTEYGKLSSFFADYNPSNMILLKTLPKEDYDLVVASCDIGMIFLDYRFTIPNFPSRILDYMQAAIPVLACTDKHTDVGDTIVNGGFGWWCESNNILNFVQITTQIDYTCLKAKGCLGFEYLKTNYSVKNAYDTIIRRVDH